MPPEINLLRAKTGVSPEITQLSVQLRRISLIAVIAVLITGSVVAGTYFYLQSTLTTLMNQKSQLLANITANARKETLYRLLKGQLGIAGKVIKTQKQWSGALDLVERITGSSQLTGFSLNDKKQLLIALQAPSVEDAATTITGIISEAGQNHLKNPVLQSFQMDPDGTIKMSLVFLPLL